MTSGPFVVARQILRNPALRRVLGAFLLFNAAEFGTWVAILLYAYEETGPASVGIVALLQLVPAALVAPPAAGLGDRFPRRRVLLVGYMVQALAMAATAATMLIGSSVVIVYVAAGAAAASLVVTRPTQSALLPSMSRTPDELTAANGASGVVEGAGVLLGPLVAAAVVTIATIPVVFALAAGALGVAALLVIGIRPATRAVDDPVPLGTAAPATELRSAGPGVVVAGLQVLLADADARVVVGLLSMRMLVIGAADVLFVLLAFELLGMGAAGAGVLNAALGAGAIVGGIATFAVVGRSRLAMIAAAGAILWGAGLAGATLLGSPMLATLLIVAGGAGLAVLDVAGRTILQRSIRDEVLSRVFGLQEGMAMAGLAAGSVLVPFLVVPLGLTWAALVIAALLPVAVAISWSRLETLDARTIIPVKAISLLRITRTFAGLPGPPLEAVARRATWQTVPPGTVVIRQGDPGDRYYVIESGRFRVDLDGRPIRELSAPGDGFGEIALLSGVPRTASVTAMEPSTLLVIGRAAFLDALTGRAARPEPHERSEPVG